MSKKNVVNIVPHPDKVLIKITKASWDELFYKKIKRDDGQEIQLFTSVEEKEGYDQRFTQNVSVGHVVAVGVNVKNIYLHDIAIIDYLVSNDNDCLVGFVNGDRLVSLLAKTTYHEYDARPDVNFRKAFVRGDYNEVSKILGVVRNKEIIAFKPYVFLNHQSNKIVRVLPNGQLLEGTETISKRDVLSTDEKRFCKAPDRIVLKEEDMFSRIIEHESFTGNIEKKEVSLVFENDILCKII